MIKLNKLKTKNKRAQEEIVGFVTIVLIVSVVALVFLGISFRKTTPVESSTKVENFIASMMGVTTDCSVKKTPQYLDYSELTKACYKGTKCYDGRKACEALKNITEEIMDSTFRITNESSTNYYSIKSYYLENASLEETEGLMIQTVEKGNCTGTRSGNTQSMSALPGIIRIEARICRS